MYSALVRLLAGAWKQVRCRRCFIILLVGCALMTILVRTTTLSAERSAHWLVHDPAVSQRRLAAMLQTYAKPPGGAPMRGGGIPKIFHQTYKTEMLPTDYRAYVAKCRNLNPDWSYFLWRDEDIAAFMAEHFPQYVRKYRIFTMNLQRADFIRYMVLYQYGGIYLDMDVECLKPFFPSLEGHAAFLDQERREHAQILYGRKHTAMNSAMGSAAGHPFFLYMLESIDSADDGLTGAGFTTGPDRLTMVYAEWSLAPRCMQNYPVTLLEPEVFSPIADVSTHNFQSICASTNDKSERWQKAGCRLLSAKNWSADATSNRTVGRHLFLHMGYVWGPKARSYFDVAKALGPVHFYRVHRMRGSARNASSAAPIGGGAVT